MDNTWCIVLFIIQFSELLGFHAVHAPYNNTTLGYVTSLGHLHVHYNEYSKIIT
jgi:hypothetical protein